jgi:hypothetical protein
VCVLLLVMVVMVVCCWRLTAREQEVAVRLQFSNALTQWCDKLVEMKNVQSTEHKQCAGLAHFPCATVRRDIGTAS